MTKPRSVRAPYQPSHCSVRPPWRTWTTARTLDSPRTASKPELAFRPPWRTWIAEPIRLAKRFSINNRAFAPAAALLTLIAGCQPPPSPAPADSLSFPPVVLSSPEEAAKGVLLTLKADLKSGTPTRGSSHGDQTVAHLLKFAAIDQIKERWPKTAMGEARREQAPGMVVRGWGLVVAHYIDGLDFNATRRELNTEKIVKVVVPAKLPDSYGQGAADAAIRVECVLVGAEWRVVRIDYSTKSAASQPASQPASRAAG